MDSGDDSELITSYHHSSDTQSLEESSYSLLSEINNFYSHNTNSSFRLNTSNSDDEYEDVGQDNSHRGIPKREPSMSDYFQPSSLNEQVRSSFKGRKNHLHLFAESQRPFSFSAVNSPMTTPRQSMNADAMFADESQEDLKDQPVINPMYTSLSRIDSTSSEVGDIGAAKSTSLQLLQREQKPVKDLPAIEIKTPESTRLSSRESLETQCYQSFVPLASQQSPAGSAESNITQLVTDVYVGSFERVLAVEKQPFVEYIVHFKVAFATTINLSKSSESREKKLTSKQHQWQSVRRRYKQFNHFHDALLRRITLERTTNIPKLCPPNTTVPPLPPKQRILSWFSKNDDLPFIRNRMSLLNDYLQSLLKLGFASHPYLLRFLSNENDPTDIESTGSSLTPTSSSANILKDIDSWCQMTTVKGFQLDASSHQLSTDDASSDTASNVEFAFYFVHVTASVLHPHYPYSRNLSQFAMSDAANQLQVTQQSHNEIPDEDNDSGLDVRLSHFILRRKYKDFLDLKQMLLERFNIRTPELPTGQARFRHPANYFSLFRPMSAVDQQQPEDSLLEMRAQYLNAFMQYLLRSVGRQIFDTNVMIEFLNPTLDYAKSFADHLLQPGRNNMRQRSSSRPADVPINRPKQAVSKPPPRPASQTPASFSVKIHPPTRIALIGCFFCETASSANILGQNSRIVDELKLKQLNILYIFEVVINKRRYMTMRSNQDFISLDRLLATHFEQHSIRDPAVQLNRFPQELLTGTVSIPEEFMKHRHESLTNYLQQIVDLYPASESVTKFLDVDSRMNISESGMSGDEELDDNKSFGRPFSVKVSICENQFRDLDHGMVTQFYRIEVDYQNRSVQPVQQSNIVTWRSYSEFCTLHRQLLSEFTSLAAILPPPAVFIPANGVPGRSLQQSKTVTTNDHFLVNYLYELTKKPEFCRHVLVKLFLSSAYGFDVPNGIDHQERFFHVVSEIQEICFSETEKYSYKSDRQNPISKITGFARTTRLPSEATDDSATVQRLHEQLRLAKGQMLNDTKVLKVRVVEFSLDRSLNNDKYFVIYEVDVVTQAQCYTISRRYNDFAKLADLIRERYGNGLMSILPSFPPKAMTPVAHDRSLLLERQSRLNAFLQSIHRLSLFDSDAQMIWFLKAS